MPGARKYPVELLERPTERPHPGDVFEGGGRKPGGPHSRARVRARGHAVRRP